MFLFFVFSCQIFFAFLRFQISMLQAVKLTGNSKYISIALLVTSCIPQGDRYIIKKKKNSLQSSAVHTHTDTHAAISCFNFPLSQSYISYRNISQNVAVNVTVLYNQNVQRCSNDVPISM